MKFEDNLSAKGRVRGELIQSITLSLTFIPRVDGIIVNFFCFPGQNLRLLSLVSTKRVCYSFM